MSKTKQKPEPIEEIIDDEVINQNTQINETEKSDADSVEENTTDNADDSDKLESNPTDTKEETEVSESTEEKEANVHIENEENSDNVDTKGIDGEEEKPVIKIPDGAKWYILHTYAGHENKVARSLKQRAEAMKFDDRVFDIIVPTRNTIKVSGGKKETVQEKIFPGYVLVRMLLDDESWFMVRSTPGVTSFIGAGNKPTPISEKEVAAIMKFMKQEEPTYKLAFSVGEAVKITDGPFSDFLGTIDSIDEARGKVKVLVSIFGRETPVELDFLQVKKI